MTIDYTKEADQLSNGFWRPPTGATTIITALSELSDKAEIAYGGKDGGEPQVTQKVDLEIAVDGMRHTWRVTANLSSRSLYGQLVQLGRQLGGLTDQKLKVVRRGDGRATTYAVSAVTD